MILRVTLMPVMWLSFPALKLQELSMILSEDRVNNEIVLCDCVCAANWGWSTAIKN